MHVLVKPNQKVKKLNFFVRIFKILGVKTPRLDMLTKRVAF